MLAQKFEVKMEILGALGGGWVVFVGFELRS
jgi:hypothetical protein